MAGYSRGYSLRWAVVFLVAVLLTAVAADQTCAHKLNLFAYAKEGRIHTEGYYAGGGKAKGATVSLYEGESKLMEGVSDENGHFSFAIPKVAELKVVLTDRRGHRDIFILTKEEVKGAFEKGEKTGTEAKGQAAGPPLPAPSPATPPLTREEMEQILEGKIAPLAGRIEELQKKTERRTASEIIGGIGYIAGLFGLLMYLKARRFGSRKKG